MHKYRDTVRTETNVDFHAVSLTCETGINAGEGVGGRLPTCSGMANDERSHSESLTERLHPPSGRWPERSHLDQLISESLCGDELQDTETQPSGGLDIVSNVVDEQGTSGFDSVSVE